MITKQPDQKIEIGGKVDGIGNVIGDHSRAHVEIHNNYNLFRRCYELLQEMSDGSDKLG